MCSSDLRDFPWSLDRVIADCCDLMDSLGVTRFHLVAAKIGATIARAFAARQPDRVVSLTLVGAPPPVRDTPAALEQRARDLELGGAPALEAWVRATMDGRLGSAFPDDGAAWWAWYMASTRVDTEVGFIRGLLGADIGPDLARIACPTLVITTQGSGLSTVEETRAWQQRIPQSRLEVLPGDSYHAAVTDAAECVRLTLAFLHEGT